MHRLKSHLGLLLFIGMFSLGVKAEEPSDEQLEDLRSRHMVYVEPSAAVKIHTEDEDAPRADYKDRVGSWGFLLGVNYSNFRPDQYQPNFQIGGYSDWYGGPSSPAVELHLQPKKNTRVGSFGLDLAGSYYASNTSNGDGTSLTITLAQAGFVFNADRLFPRVPYVVPYIEGGAYMVMYSESTPSQDTFKGNTSLAPFIAAGLSFQLDWLDPQSSAETYKQTPLKGFYAFLEERRYFVSSKEEDPDFSSTFWSAGIKAEF